MLGARVLQKGWGGQLRAFFKITAILRNNSHTIKFTILKYTIQRLEHPLSLSNSRIFLSHQNMNWPILDISCQWNHKICSPL